jgi:uncharacterized protein with FMN-binding domain
MDIFKRLKFNAERLIGTIAVFSLVLALLIGGNRSQGQVLPFLSLTIPQAGWFEAIGNDLYVAYQDASLQVKIGYVATVQTTGYGGPMRVAVATDLLGNIIGLEIIDHAETPSWFQRINDSEFITSLLGKKYSDTFQLGQDVDGISGATYTSRAIVEAAMKGSRTIAASQMGVTFPQETPPRILIGLPEVFLVGLYALGFIAKLKKFKYKKQIRWLSILTGMLVIGFIYTRPLTLSDISKLLLGFWPQWQTSLYWYLLIIGILFIFTVDNKNPYCEWFCPFGAAQECLGAVGGAKSRSTGSFKSFLIWLQRGLAWLALFLALLYRNPGLTSYEIFGTLFDLKGTILQFALLGLVLVGSLFIRRPWCTYLCPLKPVTDLYCLLRNWIVESWMSIRKK